MTSPASRSQRRSARPWRSTRSSRRGCADAGNARGIPLPEINLKQAWRIPSCEPLPNPNGSAPGWFVSRPDGGVAIALPGPPREMRPMWSNEVLPRLRDRGLGADMRGQHLPPDRHRRVGGGRGPWRGAAPPRRPRGRDVCPARGGRRADQSRSVPTASGRPPNDRVDAAAAIVRERLGEHIWAEGETTLGRGGRRAADRARLAARRRGDRHGGQVAALFGDVAVARLARIRPPDEARPPTRADDGARRAPRRSGMTPSRCRLAVREPAGAEVGLAVRVAAARRTAERRQVAVVTPTGEHRQTPGDLSRRPPMGRSRARPLRPLGDRCSTALAATGPQRRDAASGRRRR